MGKTDNGQNAVSEKWNLAREWIWKLTMPQILGLYFGMDMEGTMKRVPYTLIPTTKISKRYVSYPA